MRTLVAAALLVAMTSDAHALSAPSGTGATGSIGPIGSSGNACTGAPAATCCCTPTACSVQNCAGSSDSWESNIENAALGDTIVLDNGTYNAGGGNTVDLPAGVTVIKRAGHNSVVITSEVRVNGGDVHLEGVSIDVGETEPFALNIFNESSTPRSDITLRSLKLLGGHDTCVQIAGSIDDLLLESSWVDGGRDEHGLVIECRTLSGGQGGDPDTCAFVPDNITVRNNLLTRAVGVTYTDTQDAIKLRGIGRNIVIINNTLIGNNVDQNLIHAGDPGTCGTTLRIEHNYIGPSTGSSALMNGSWGFFGRRIEFVRNFLADDTGTALQVDDTAAVVNNLFDDAAVEMGSSFGVDFAHNTMIDGTLQLGEVAGDCPFDIAFQYNLFDGTHMDLANCTGSGTPVQYSRPNDLPSGISSDGVAWNHAYQITGETLGMYCDEGCANEFLGCSADADCSGCTNGCNDNSVLTLTSDPGLAVDGWRPADQFSPLLDRSANQPRHGLAIPDFDFPASTNGMRPALVSGTALYDAGADEFPPAFSSY